MIQVFGKGVTVSVSNSNRTKIATLKKIIMRALDEIDNKSKASKTKRNARMGRSR